MILNDVCELIVDCLHSTALDQGHGYPLIRTPNIGKGRFIFVGVHRVSEDTYNARNVRAIPQNNDLIFAREAPAGNVAIIKNDEKICLGQRTVLIRPNAKKINPLFLCYYLLAPLQQHGLLSTANGATVAHVNMGAIRNLKICLPSPSIQQKIADTLSAYDDLIENNRRRIQLLEESARQLYKEWFVRLRFPGHEHVRVVDGVPEGWEKKTLGEVAETNIASYSNKSLPARINYVDISSVSTGRICEKKEFPNTEAPGRARRKASTGDVIWSNVRPNLKAYALVLSPEKNDVFSTGFTIITAKEVPYTFLYVSVTTDAFVSYLSSQTTGSSYPAVRPTDFERAKILIPSRKLLQSYHEVVEALFLQIHFFEKQNHKLAQARDLLLPKLMNGEVAV